MFRLPSPDVLRHTHPRAVPVTVNAAITELDPDHVAGNGARHQILTVRITQVVSDPQHAGVAVGEELNVAIRCGDAEGLPSAIPGLAVGQPIALKGDYIPASAAYPEADGEHNAVLHWTHHPVGWVEYQGHHYQ